MRVAELVHKSLVKTFPLSEGRRGRAWTRVYEGAVRRFGDEDVTVNLHGAEATIGFSNPYPFTLRRFPQYNIPQVVAVKAQADALGRPVRVVDVGAAVGDTALMLLNDCASSIELLTCIEGDDDFFRLLRRNLGDRAQLIHAVLGAERGQVAGLEHIAHPGTAAPASDALVEAQPLDDLGVAPDVLKIDCDGFDGRILVGAQRVLREHRPLVLMEWHAGNCETIGTREREQFEVLDAAGYDRFVFYTKYGVFSHFMRGLDTWSLDRLAWLSMSSTTLPDWHYDIVAVHESSPLDERLLAETAG